MAEFESRKSREFIGNILGQSKDNQNGKKVIIRALRNIAGVCTRFILISIQENLNHLFHLSFITLVLLAVTKKYARQVCAGYETIHKFVYPYLS